MIDVIVIGVVALAALGVVTFLVMKLTGALDAENVLRDLYEKQREATDAVVEERNATSVQLGLERDKSKTLQDRLSVAESERNDATRALAVKVAEGIKNAPDAASALAALHDILRIHLPGTDPAGAGGDGAEAPAVPPAGATPSSEGGGHA